MPSKKISIIMLLLFVFISEIEARMLKTVVIQACRVQTFLGHNPPRMRDLMAHNLSQLATPLVSDT